MPLSAETLTLVEKYKNDRESLTGEEKQELLQVLKKASGTNGGVKTPKEPVSVDSEEFRKAFQDTYLQALKTGTLTTLKRGQETLVKRGIDAAKLAALGYQALPKVVADRAVKNAEQGMTEGEKADALLKAKQFKSIDIRKALKPFADDPKLRNAFETRLEEAWDIGHDVGNIIARVGAGVAVGAGTGGLGATMGATGIAIDALANAAVEATLPPGKFDVNFVNSLKRAGYIPEDADPEMVARAGAAGIAGILSAGGHAFFRLWQMKAAQKMMRKADQEFNKETFLLEQAKLRDKAQRYKETVPEALEVVDEFDEAGKRTGNSTIRLRARSNKQLAAKDIEDVVRWLDTPEMHRLLREGDPDAIEVFQAVKRRISPENPRYAPKMEEMELEATLGRSEIDNAAIRLRKRMAKVFGNKEGVDDEWLDIHAAIYRAASIGGRNKDVNAVEFLDNIDFTDKAIKGPTARGAIDMFEDGKALIHALEGANSSTLIHELTHYLTPHLLPEQKAILEKAMKITNGVWGKEHFEQVARWGERYFREGKSPTKELVPVFKRLKQWIRDIYKSIKGSSIEKRIDRKVRNVFDDLFTPTEEEQIRTVLGGGPQARRDITFLQAAEGLRPGQKITERIVPMNAKKSGLDNFLKTIKSQTGREGQLRGARRAMVDRLEAVEAMEHQITNEREGPLYRAARMLPRVAGKVRHQLVSIQLTPKGKPVEPEQVWWDATAKGGQGAFRKWGPGLETILEPFTSQSPKETQYFIDYALSKRIVEVSGRDIKTGVDVKDAREFINFIENSPQGELYAEQLDQLVHFEDFYLHELKRAGVLNNKQIIDMKKKGVFYIPLKRFFDETSEGGKRLRTNIGKPLKKLVGTDRMFLHPINSIIENAYSMTMAAERNKIFQKLVRMADSAGELGVPWAQEVEQYKSRDWSLYVDEIRNVLKANEQRLGKDLKNYGFALTNVDNLTDDEILRYASIMKPVRGGDQSNFVTVYFNGKPKVYRLDPTIAAAFQQGDITAGNIFINALDKVAHGFTALKRATATQINPEFPLFNLFRDQFTAMIYSKYGKFNLPFVDIPRALMRMASGNDEMWLDFIRAGGTNASLASLDQDAVAAAARKIGNQMDYRGIIDPIKFRASKIFDGFVNANDALELVTRFQEFGKGYKKLGDAKTYDEIMDLIYDSQEVTLDFYRAGTVGQKVNRYWAFWNAWMQGNSRFYRAIKGKDKTKVMARLVSAMSIPTIAAQFALLKDPEIRNEYMNRQDWERTIFWHFPFKKDGEVKFLRAPKPLGPLMLFTAPVEAAMQYAATKDETVLTRIAQQTLSELGTEKTKTMMPDILAPIMEILYNKDMFRNIPVESHWDKKRLTEYRYDDRTSEFAKAASQVLSVRPLDLSPKEIDHLLRGYFTGIGKLGLDFSDKIFELLGERVARPKPWFPERVVLARRFVSKKPGMSGRFVGNFYEDLNTSLGAFTQLKEQETDEDVRKFILKHESDLLGRSGFNKNNSVPRMGTAIVTRYKMMNSIQGKLKELRNARNAVFSNEEIDPETKNRVLNQIGDSARDIVMGYRKWEEGFYKRYLDK